MIGQATEIMDKSQTFAERFGWEALVVVALLVFIALFTWRVGGRIGEAITKYLEASIAQLHTQGEAQDKAAQAMAMLSRNAETSEQVTQQIFRITAENKDQTEKILGVLLAAARLAYDTIPPDTSPEVRDKLLRVIRDLEK